MVEKFLSAFPSERPSLVVSDLRRMKLRRSSDRKARCVMEKMIKKMMVAGLACVALCGSALAAPKHGNGPAPRGKAPMVQTMRHETRKPVQAHKPAPAHHQTKAPAHRHDEVRPTHRMPPPRPVTPCHRHHHRGWCPPPPPHDPSSRCRGELRPVDIPHRPCGRW